jgi:signal transduction histidine kinase
MARLDLVDLSRRVLASQLVIKGITTEFVCSTETVMVSADRDLIEIVLAEVLDNARKAVSSSEAPAVLVEVDRLEQWALIRVHDNGCGIPDENRNLIFENFKSGWLNGVERSTGLGLGWIRRVIEAHGGGVRIEASRFGCGVCFVFSLPAVQQETRT